MKHDHEVVMTALAITEYLEGEWHNHEDERQYPGVINKRIIGVFQHREVVIELAEDLEAALLAVMRMRDNMDVYQIFGMCWDFEVVPAVCAKYFARHYDDRQGPAYIVGLMEEVIKEQEARVAERKANKKEG